MATLYRMTNALRALLALALASPALAQFRAAPQIRAVSPVPAAASYSAAAAHSASLAPSAASLSPAYSLSAAAALAPAAAAAPASYDLIPGYQALLLRTIGPSIVPAHVPLRENVDPSRWSAALFDGGPLHVTRSGSIFAIDQRPGEYGGRVGFFRVQSAPQAQKRVVAGTEGLSGDALAAEVRRVALSGKKVLDKEVAWKLLFSKIDNHTLNGVRGVADAYSGVFVPGTGERGDDYPERGDQNGDGEIDKRMNVEHVFPQGFFDKKQPWRTDLHHLMATFEHPNGIRGSLPFGEVKGHADYTNRAGAKRKDMVAFEPPDFTKGKVARIMLNFFLVNRSAWFMSHREVREFWLAQVDVLLDWNRRFPVSVEEMRRNDEIQGAQGNRNPLIDDPGLVDRIGAAWFKHIPSPGPRSDKRRESAGGPRPIELVRVPFRAPPGTPEPSAEPETAAAGAAPSGGPRVSRRFYLSPEFRRDRHRRRHKR